MELDGIKSTEPLVFKGQLFFVDNYTDLPCYNGEKEVDQNWDELKLYNNYGTIQLVGKNP